MKNAINELTTDARRTWITAGPYRVLLNRTGEGLIVDVYPAEIDVDEPVATAWAHDNDFPEEFK
jgi:hypothetical protein